MSPSRYERTMKEIATQTLPSDLAVLRCRERIDQDRPVPSTSPRAWPQPTPRALRRVRWRIRHPQQRPSYRPLLHAGLALALVLVLWVTFSPTLLSPLSRSSPTLLSLTSSGTAALSPSPYLNLDYSGKGQLQGERDLWALTWEQGSVTVHLDPEADAQLEVQTEEALVEVIGTVFDVQRDTLGTHVSVERGLVRVTCRRNPKPQTLSATQEHTCWPTTPAGLLARALYLADHKGSTDEQLATIREGLLVSDPHDPVHGELLAHQITTFIGDQQHQEALTAAHQYLTLTDSPRTQSIRNVAVQLAISLSACEEARALVQGGDVDPSSILLAQERCP